MKNIFLTILFLFGTMVAVNAQDKTTYVEVHKMQTGWTAVISNSLSTDTNQIDYDFMPKMSERLYVLPSSGKLFDTHIYALNYLAKFGFEVIEVYQMDGSTCFLMECDDMVTIPVTTDWTTKKNITINM